MRLIPHAAKAWRLFTVQIAALAIIWGSLPVDVQSAVLGLVGIGPERIPAILGLLMIAGRLISQTPEDK